MMTRDVGEHMKKKKNWSITQTLSGQQVEQMFKCMNKEDNKPLS